MTTEEVRGSRFEVRIENEEGPHGDSDFLILHSNLEPRTSSA